MQKIFVCLNLPRLWIFPTQIRCSVPCSFGTFKWHRFCILNIEQILLFVVK
jgi:hypothetical protein